MSGSREAWWGRPPPRVAKADPEKRYSAPFALFLSGLLILTVMLCAYLLRPAGSLPVPEGLLQTKIQMKGLELAIRSHAVHYNCIPYGSASNILSVLAGESDDGQNPDRIIFMQMRQGIDFDKDGNYLDGWGNPIRFEVNTANQQIMLHSLGPNGVPDERGGDDVYMLVWPGER